MYSCSIWQMNRLRFMNTSGWPPNRGFCNARYRPSHLTF